MRSAPRGLVRGGRPADQPLRLIILGVAFLIGIGGALNYLPIFSFLPIIAFVASAVYLADVRPKISNLGGGSRQGPYGPW